MDTLFDLYGRRKLSVGCDACEFVTPDDIDMFGCLQCDFFVHRSCIFVPRVIKLTRHSHYLSHVFHILDDEATCGVCQGRFSSGYGGYACIDKTYVEGEEFEEAKDDVVSSLEEMDDNKKVDHFSHEHGLSRIHVDEECWQLCEACIHPIAVGTFLGCKECSFALHEECARLPLEMDHPLHRHRVPNEHQRRGFHLLEDNTKSNLCCGCREDSTSTVATCTTCEDYYLDFKCLNLPPVVRFKYDTHPLYLYIDTEHYKKQLLESERPPPYSWRDVCEEEIHENLLFYVCFDCRTTLHVKCILGRYPYMEPGHTIKEKDVEIQIASNSGACSPKCRLCRSHCRDKLVFKDDDLCFCSYKCIPFYQIFNF
ncbi:hypothetical protein Bca101_006634 [Brassica carinata]